MFGVVIHYQYTIDNVLYNCHYQTFANEEPLNVENENVGVQLNDENGNSHQFDDADELNGNIHEQQINDPIGIANRIESLTVDGLPTDDGCNEIDPLLLKDEFVVLNEGQDDEEIDSGGAEVFAEEFGDMVMYYEVLKYSIN